MSCCVRTCKKNKSEDTLFHFPVDERLQTVWVTILKENNVVDPDWELTEDSQICINHFNNSCCIKTENDVLLQGEAYPSIFEVDDYLIEEIFEDGVDNLISTTYEEVIGNGEENTSLNTSEDLLDKHITMEEENNTQETNAQVTNIVNEKVTKSVSKLKNISVTPKPATQPKTIDISKRIENPDGNEQKIPMFKVVPEKLNTDQDKNSKDSGFKLVPDDSSSPSKPIKAPVQPPSNLPNNKSMQAIQIGSQFYVVSPNTPDGKELTPSQLAAIKEKLMKEMGAKGTGFKKQLTIALDSPKKALANSKKSLPKILPKKVTTIDLNKGLPKQLKEIISDKNTKKRKVDEEAETFTVSSSLDIMPVTAAKKARTGDNSFPGISALKMSDFPGNIHNGNMNSMLPSITINNNAKESLSTENPPNPNRTQFGKLLQEINKNMPALNKNSWSHVYDQNLIAISKTQLVENQSPRQFLSIVIDVSLQATIYKNSCLLSNKELLVLNINVSQPIKTWTELKAVMDKLNLIKGTEEHIVDFGVVDPNQYNNYINKTISVCKQIINHGRLGVQEHDQKIVSFISEQLALLNESKEFRKYSVNLLVFCYILYTSSPTVYESLRKVLLIPDGSLLKEIASADISRDFVHINEHRMVRLASKINGFSKKDKVVVLQMYNIAVPNMNISNVLMFVASSVCKSFSEVIYFCPIQDSVVINRVHLLSLEIIKRLENIGLQVAAFIAEYNELSFGLFKQFSIKKNEKTVSVPHPFDKRRKLFLLFENSSILTAVCWDWITKDHVMFPSLFVAVRQSTTHPSKLQPQKASFQAVANFIKKQKVHVYFKHLNVQNQSLMNQVLNKETVHVDENQKSQFALNIFTEKLVHALEINSNKDVNLAGEFMRIIYDWWCIVTANSSRSLLKDKFKLSISEKNKEPIHKLNTISKWVNTWRLQDRTKLKLSPAVFYVLGENCAGYKQLAESLLRDYLIDQFFLGTFQVNLPSDLGFITSSLVETCKFPSK